ncbi:hypothetical protein EVB91_088 [Rhizobium phage RHph_I1_18]|nr:hypothetical protein EVB91_088 [Rhizobium phage RHph_I1_18]
MNRFCDCKDCKKARRNGLVLARGRRPDAGFNANEAAKDY